MENLLEAIGMIQHCVSNMSDKEENVNVRIGQTPGRLLSKRQTTSDHLFNRTFHTQEPKEN
jgi:hypothetical protein